MILLNLVMVVLLHHPSGIKKRENTLGFQVKVPFRVLYAIYVGRKWANVTWVYIWMPNMSFKLNCKTNI